MFRTSNIHSRRINRRKQDSSKRRKAPFFSLEDELLNLVVLSFSIVILLLLYLDVSVRLLQFMFTIQDRSKL